MAREVGEQKGWSRRNALLIGLGLVAVAGGWQLWLKRPRPFSFQAIPGLPDWRMLEFDGLSVSSGSATSAIFAGLEADGDNVAPLPVGDLCDTLFQNPEQGVPIALFSDFFCPYCRVLTARMADRIKRGTSGIAVTWHELPLLGQSSVIAAKAALAADNQGAYPEFSTKLMQSPFRPSPQFLAQIAEATGIDAETLLSDMESADVQNRLTASLAASKTLGIWATPAMVVGRTVVMGQISDDELDTLIEIEAGAQSIC
ncbi:MAG: DsbA family protein [Boseongicola sp.]|nr:DsbA family protein [Boseongicola sp.]MDD9977416.1 DsbA family protein [Boseongicola sp.]